MVSITGLEFSYTQAPNSMKSVIMALWLLTVATANLIVGRFHGWNSLPGGQTKITDLQFYFGCTWLMFGTAALFVVAALFYKGKTYVQGEAKIAEADIEAVVTRMPA